MSILRIMVADERRRTFILQINVVALRIIRHDLQHRLYATETKNVAGMGATTHGPTYLNINICRVYTHRPTLIYVPT